MNRIGVWLAVLCSMGFLVVGACSSDSAQPAATGDGGTSALPDRVVRVDEVRAMLKPLADAECKWLFQCCNADERADQLGPGPTAADCSDRVLQAEAVMYSYYQLPLKDSTKAVLRELTRLGYGFDYGRVTVDPAAVTACAKSISEAACGVASPKDHCVPKPPVTNDPCDTSKLLIGKQQMGDECDGNSYDCAPGLFCEYVDGNRGVCLKSPKEADTCFGDQDCGTAVCDWATGKCIKGAAFGEPCSYADADRPEPGTEKIRCGSAFVCDTITLKCADRTCAGGSNCSVDTNCPMGTTCITNRCGKPAKNGVACYKDTDCERGKCRFDQNSGRQVCLDSFPDGSRCNQPDDCSSHYCKFGMDGTGACAPQVPVDAPCPTGRGDECVSEKCGSGAMGFVCLKGAAAGDVCLVDQDCNVQDKLYCIAKKCAKAPFEDGTDCMTPDQCKSEVCLVAKCTPKGQAGAVCGTSKAAPCDTGFYCDASSADGSPEGTCKAKKPEGAPCTTATECWNDCRASHGVLRCLGVGAGTTHCGG